MTKVEKIQEAYTSYWEVVQHYVDKDGWYHSPILKDDMVLYQKLEEFCENKNNLLRPNSLRGIEDNNGWVKIESEDDLPNVNTECHFELENKQIKIGAYIKDRNMFLGIIEQYFPFEIIRYNPILEPKKMVY